MPCPKDGMEYITIGDKRVCPKCGHVPGYKQIDIIKILEELESIKKEAMAITECTWQQDIPILVRNLIKHRTGTLYFKPDN